MVEHRLQTDLDAHIVSGIVRTVQCGQIASVEGLVQHDTRCQGDQIGTDRFGDEGAGARCAQVQLDHLRDEKTQTEAGKTTTLTVP